MCRYGKGIISAALVCGALTLGRPATPSADQDTSNLLSYASGTIVRSYSHGLTGVYRLADGGGEMEDGTKGPLVVVWEMPGVATLSALQITLAEGAKGTIAVSTTSATDGFRDLGSVQGEDAKVAAAAGVKARWVKATVTFTGTNQPIGKVVASGTLAPRPANAPAITGDFWAYGNDLNGNGGVLPKPADGTPERIEVTVIGNAVNAAQCSETEFVRGYPGTLSGRVWTYRSEAAGGNVISGKLFVNDEGTVIVGGDNDFAGMHAFVRTAGGPLPDFCRTKKYGTGASNALVLQAPHWSENYPGDSAAHYAQFKNVSTNFTAAALLTPALLNGMDMAVLNGICRPVNLLSSGQTEVLMQWVQAGHKLLITDSDMCGGEPVDYSFLPYKFQSDNPGAKGAQGHTLVVVENDSLGTTEKADASHFIDTAAYVANKSQQIGDANTVVTQDAHWCGHLFGVNADGANGFMQMYAPYGKGLLIYDGFDVDDEEVPQYRTIRSLEYAVTLPPDLPCSRHVDSGFVLVSDAARTFVPGTASTITVPMQVLSNRDWKGHVTLAASGDFPATVSPAAVDLPPGTRDVTVSINVPATARAGHYSVTVKGTSGSQTAQALVSFESKETSSTLKSTLDASCTAAIYGVNFDFNKTTIRPDADPVLQQLLALFKGDPSLNAEIGGHTDNVGTAAYNLTLSAGRADAVKAWLVAHGIAASRLTTHGYGDTVPLVPNDSDANRAKNRRVELKKANCAK